MSIMHSFSNDTIHAVPCLDDHISKTKVAKILTWDCPDLFIRGLKYKKINCLQTVKMVAKQCYHYTWLLSSIHRRIYIISIF